MPPVLLLVLLAWYRNGRKGEMDPDAMRLVEKLLNVDPAKRPSADEACDDAFFWPTENVPKDYMQPDTDPATYVSGVSLASCQGVRVSDVRACLSFLQPAGPDSLKWPAGQAGVAPRVRGQAGPAVGAGQCSEGPHSETTLGRRSR